jgi:hypothetical protein
MLLSVESIDCSKRRAKRGKHSKHCPSSELPSLLVTVDLLAACRHGASPSSSDGDPGAQGGSGLDGIFAELGTGQGRPGPTRPQWRVSRS